MKLLSGAGLLDPELEAFFADSGKVPKAAETAVLLSNLYNWLLAQGGRGPAPVALP